MNQVTSERWREAQIAEASYWHDLNVMELLRISAEKPIFLFSIGPERCSELFDEKEVLEIGVGPIGLSLVSFYAHKHRIKKLVKIDPLPRVNLLQTGLKNEPWANQFTSWINDLTNEGEYRQTPGEDIDLEEAFDCVLTYNVLDHVRDPERILTNAHRALRPGGKLLVGVDCLSFFGRLKFEHYIRRIHKGKVVAEAHPYTFVPAHILRMMRNAGFKNITTFGIPGFTKRLVGSHTRPGFIGQK